MSSEEVWYFLRGQESVGPFSKAIIQQIYQGGQLTDGTLVWREGMAGWEPFSKVAELEIDSPAPPPQAPSPGAPAAEAGKTKLKLKSSTSVSSPPNPSAPSPTEVPAASPEKVSPVKLKLKEVSPPAQAPVTAPPLSIPQPQSPRQATAPVPQPETKEEKGGKEASEESLAPPVWKRFLWFVFSGQFLTPIFLIAGGVMMFFYSSHFPNVLGLYWLVLGYAAYGALYLFHFRAFAGLARILSVFFLLPLLRLFWPVLSSEISAKMVPVSHWFFLIFCICYFLTIWIGLNPYFTSALGRFAGFTGVLCLAFMGLVSQGKWAPGPSGEWDQFVLDGSRMRIPGALVSLLKLPAFLGESVGVLKLNFDSNENLLESVVFKPDENTHGDKEWRLIIKTLDGQFLAARIARGDEKTIAENILNQDWPLTFSKEGLNDSSMDRPRWTKSSGASIDLASGALRISELDPKTKKLTAAIHFQRAGNPPGATDSSHNEIKGDLKANYRLEAVK